MLADSVEDQVTDIQVQPLLFECEKVGRFVCTKEAAARIDRNPDTTPCQEFTGDLEPNEDIDLVK